MFKPVEPKPDFPGIEKEILEFWEKNQIFEKSREKNKSGPAFVFFEGPPGANGRPGLHHMESRAYKDIILRFQSMLGKSIVRKAGWDTHGLPVELEVEKALGISGKKQIENLVAHDKRASIEKFNKLCTQAVWKYKDEWERVTRRLGFWIDMQASYITYENGYIETCWWILKQLWERKVDGQPLLFQGHKVLPYCARCGTVLSSHEVAQGYRSITENSLYIRFLVEAKQIQAHDDEGHAVVVKLDKPTYLLSWTTTPWTLPGNVALAVGEKIGYLVVMEKNEYYIVAEDLAEEVLGHKPKILEKIKGSDLVGLVYKPLFNIKELHSEKSYQVYPADFVNTQEGTGIVHTAVMYGEDDYNLGEQVGLPKFHTVTEEGKFLENLPEIGGLAVKGLETEKIILEILREKKNFFREKPHTHDYPFCWRCGTPLLYYARTSWFIRMSALKEQLKAANEKINWVPEYIKHGRFGEWLAEIKDWAISRERYWGTPLPVWKCGSCGSFKVVGSVAELGREIKDLHRPYIDEVELKCACGGVMKRVPEVMDVWFDSGAMPYAQWHYPFENRERIDCAHTIVGSPSLPERDPSPAAQDDKPSACQFPADYISEAIDQTRGWFYTLLAVAVALGYEEPPFKNVICLGLVLDGTGKKMSKSKGNIVEPMALSEKYGFDIVRWYMYSVNQPGEAKRFVETDLLKMQRRIQLILWNVYNYFVTYAVSNRWEPALNLEAPSDILDRWIDIRLRHTAATVSKYLAHYDVFRASRTLEEYLDDLSTWYLRRSRGRSEKIFFTTLYGNLLSLIKMMAPFMPFVTEAIYRNLRTREMPESLHLCAWPEGQEISEDEKKVLENMREVRTIVEAVLAWRKTNTLKVRQPLGLLHVKSANAELKDYIYLLADELNFLSVTVSAEAPAEAGTLEKLAINSPGKPEVYLDKNVTDELKARGMAREMEREVQELRKTSGLKVGQMVRLYYETTSQQVYEAFEYFDQNKAYITRVIGAREKVNFEKEIEVTGQKVWLGLKK
jgi:isoleucyl-tRNA synthetase